MHGGPVGNFDEDVIAKSYDHNLMIRMLGYAKPYWRAVLICIFLLACMTGVDLVIPFLHKEVIDRYISLGRAESVRAISLARYDETQRAAVLELAVRYPIDCKVKEGPKGKTLEVRRRLYGKLSEGDLALLRSPDFAGVLRIIFLLVLILLGKVICEIVQFHFMQRTGQQVMFDMRQQLFEHLQGLAVRFFDRNPVGRLVTRVANDVNVVQEMFTAVLINLFKDIFLLVGIVAAMLWLHWQLALVSFVVLPPLVVASILFRIKVRQAYRQIRLLLAQLNAFLAEHLSGARVVQVFNQQDRCLADFEEKNEAHFQAQRHQIKVHALYRPFVDLLSSCAQAAIFWYGGGRVLAGNLSFGALVAFFYYLQMFFRPIRDLSEKYNIVQAAMASSERIFSLLDTDDRIATEEGDPLSEAIVGEIEARNVWFAYKDEDWVLRDVSFHVRPGESLALVGHTGAGKTSIINLLTRLYEFQKGQILVDGRDIRTLEPTVLRRALGCVRQDVFSFSGSVAHNIALRNPDIPESVVEEAAQYVNADRFIRALPEGYATEVMERGVLLSAGQRQLLSFARALVHKPCVLLLDEATSNIDTKTEQEIQDALEKLTSRYTSVVVAHRLSTIRKATRILVLNKGEVRERGTHEELMAEKGLYYKLHQLSTCGHPDTHLASAKDKEALS